MVLAEGDYRRNYVSLKAKPIGSPARGPSRHAPEVCVPAKRPSTGSQARSPRANQLLASTSFGQVMFDEGFDGEISDDGLNPTVLALGLGVNTISGTIGPDPLRSGGTAGTDGDFFTFNLAPGLLVDSITAIRSGPGNQSFFGYAPGTTIGGVFSGLGGVTNGDLISNVGTLNNSGIAAIPQTLLAEITPSLFRKPFRARWNSRFRSM